MLSDDIITRPFELSKKSPTSRMVTSISALILVGAGYCLSQPSVTERNVSTPMNVPQTIKKTPGYLDKKDPILLSIKARAVAELKESAKRSDPESTENKSLAAQIKTWTEEKQHQLQTLGEKSMNDYADQIQLDVETFMTVFSALGETDQKKITDEYDFRVQYMGGNKYVAEFWEDGLAVNSEANAVISAHELANSGYVKKHPDSGVGNVEQVKKTYANVRKSIAAGKRERYTKVMGLLYTQVGDGPITFNDPGQPMIDFVRKNSK